VRQLAGSRSRGRVTFAENGVHPKDALSPAISSSALANSEGRRAGNPKQAFPPSIAGSQYQLFSTGKQRNALTGRPANASSIGQMRSSHIAGKMASESPSVQPMRKGLGTMKILSDQEHVPPGQCHLSPPKTDAAFVVARIRPDELFNALLTVSWRSRQQWIRQAMRCRVAEKPTARAS
jgi:hypothetical protein